MKTTTESKPVELMRRLRRQLAEEYEGLSAQERRQRMRQRIAEHPILRRWSEHARARAASS